MGRHLFDLGDALAYSRLVDQYLCIPKTALSASTEDRILALDGPLFDLERARLLLLKSVHESHWFVCLGQVVEFWTVKDVFVVDWSVLFCLERLELQISVLELELLFCLSLACHLDDLVKTERVELGLQVVIVTPFFRTIFDLHHVVKRWTSRSFLLFIHFVLHLTTICIMS